ncbi:hypothetical protein [Entomobacter blattae]|uniref:Uncharacterized protein n=1 Tax=Entomobacter blattae TaxID=2762277 RepID=A0A7H1NUE9_9PROT|nr:hypothetical protein [Entomobacter blattae]QNT79409.1 hypothetical protein JGUZn3_22080 [Entomobacter blattae]
MVDIENKTEFPDEEIVLKMMNLMKENRSDYQYSLFEKDMEPTEENFQHLAYIINHDLANNVLRRTIDNRWLHGTPMHLTVAGLDYLSHWGGITATNKTFTITIAGETIRALIEAQIEASNATEREKNSFKAHLKHLPQKVLEAQLPSLISQGLSQIPDIFSWIGKLSDF